MNPNEASDFAAQIALAAKPDLWDRLLGPSAALVLALVVIYFLWKKFEASEARGVAREDSMALRIRALEDSQRELLVTVLGKNSEAFMRHAGALDAMGDSINDLRVAIGGMPRCAAVYTPVRGPRQDQTPLDLGQLPQA